jgi:hypothetical protein
MKSKGFIRKITEAHKKTKTPENKLNKHLLPE